MTLLERLAANPVPDSRDSRLGARPNSPVGQSADATSRRGSAINVGGVTASAVTAAVLTVCALAVIVLFTLGKPFIEIPGILDASAHHRRSLDLQMFNGFDHPKVWWGPWTNTLGNIALFMPLGVAVQAWVVRASAKHPGTSRWGRACYWVAAGVAMGVGLLASLAVEAAQYALVLGYSDIDDVVFNTLGAGAGAGVAAACASPGAARRLRWFLIYFSIAICAVGAYGLVNGRL